MIRCFFHFQCHKDSAHLRVWRFFVTSVQVNCFRSVTGMIILAGVLVLLQSVINIYCFICCFQTENMI